MAVEVKFDASYNVYAIERQHYRNSGTIALPVYGRVAADKAATPGTAVNCRIVRLHAPIESLIIKWTAVREGKAPDVPNPYLSDTNFVFKCGVRNGAIPMTLAGYTGHAWSIAGQYEYHVLAPTDLNSDFFLGLYPWDASLAMTDSKIPQAAFVLSILEVVRRAGGPGA